jgi:HemY protein
LTRDRAPVVAAPPPPELPVQAEPSPPPVAESSSAPKPPKLAPRVEAVIPLLHVPDDPGPDPAPDLDPEPEPPGGSRGLRLFK